MSTLQKIMSVGMCWVLMMGFMFPQFTFAQDINEAEQQWRESVRSKRAAGTGLIVGGSVGTAVGLGLMVSGLIDRVDATTTPGCFSSGAYSITCNDQNSLQEANDKLEQGQTKILVGTVVSTIAEGLLIWGIVKRVKARRMVRQGKAKGYSLSMNLDRNNEFSLALNYRF